MRRFIVVGQTASASGDFSLDDLPGSSGRLDVLLRCVRAALLTSHGLRRDVVVYLVLQRGPRVVRLGGESLKFVRPDERSLATLVQKLLLRHDAADDRFVEQKPGLGVASAGLDWVLSDLGGAHPYVLEEGAPDARGHGLDESSAFFIGDHLGFDAATRSALAMIRAEPVSVGPVSLHSDDVVAIVSNELDRRR
jgi:tRNA (pseudouridine54-N1)-methyltransferase